MLPKTKKYLITTEKREVIVIHRGNHDKKISGFCAVCQTDVELLTLDAITTQTGKSTRVLFQLIENNLIHSIETGSGHLMICQNSLISFENQKFISNE